MWQTTKLITIIVFFSINFCFSQKAENNITKEKRAIFVLNLIEQIDGFKFEGDRFKIGIFKDPQIFNTFSKIAQFRSVKNRKISPYKIESIDNIKNVDAIYVQKEVGLNSKELLKKIRGKSILLITEESPNSKNNMVNITLFQNNFYLELDSANLIRNGFKASPSLIQKSLRSIKELNILLKEVAERENKEKNDLKIKKSLLEDEVEQAYSTIDIKEDLILKGKDTIYKLQATSKIKDSQLKDKTIKLKNFEKNYALQQQLLDLKNAEISDKENEIKKQDEYLDSQKELIDKQEGVLTSQKIALNNQSRINTLLIIIGILSLCFMMYIVKVNYNRKGLLDRLREKHNEVTLKSSALKQQNEELEQFAYIASHDLQEPLHTITSFADFMVEDYEAVLDQEGKENLNHIKNGCSRMGTLIKCLLDYSKIGRNRKLESIDSRNIVNTIIDDFNALIANTGAEITMGEMPTILGYSTELRMLFQNIMSNAIKFRNPNVEPKLFIEGRVLENTGDFTHRWQFQIKDNGIGIANKDQKKIFDIFQRLHTREDYSGTGIGLAHCKKVILFHHGEIWVNSALGKGTTFNFTIQFNPSEHKQHTTS